MHNWQDRVLNERAELETKIQKLNRFMLKNKPLVNIMNANEVLRLMEQLRCMEAYHDALTDRIFNFESEQDDET